jgi:diguanylate cyclase (GGDEF)-like protein/PAS domain S-box-containing protein
MNPQTSQKSLTDLLWPSAHPLRLSMVLFALMTTVIWAVTYTDYRQAQRFSQDTWRRTIESAAQIVLGHIDGDDLSALPLPLVDNDHRLLEIQAGLLQSIRSNESILDAFTIRAMDEEFAPWIQLPPPGRQVDPSSEQARFTRAAVLQVPELIAPITNSLKPVVVLPTEWSPENNPIYAFAMIRGTGQVPVGLLCVTFRADRYVASEKVLFFRSTSSFLYGTILATVIGYMIWLTLQNRAAALAHTKQMMLALQESEDRLRMFIAHAPAAVAMLDRQMRYIAYSQRWLVEHGLNNEQDITGRSHYELFPETPASVREIHQHCLAGNIETNEGERVALPSGRVLWLTWEVRPWQRIDGHVGGLLMSTRDISETVNQQSLLREQASRLDLAIQSANLATWDYDVSNEFMHFGGLGLTMLGFDASVQFLSLRRWREKIHPEDLPLVESALSDLLLGREPELRIEYRIKRLDSSWAWFSTVGRVTETDRLGLAIRAMGISMDISDAKAAELAIRCATADARRLAAAIDSHSDAVLLADAAGSITRVNQAFEHLTGYSSDEALGKPLGSLEYAREHEATYREMWSTIRCGQPWTGRLGSRRNLPRAGSSQEVAPGCELVESTLFWADVSVTPLLASDGTIEGYVAIQRDVTDEVEREERLAIAARTDELTGLGNRQFLHRRLARAIELQQRRHDYQFAVMFMDIDRFKLINDSLGHQVGDLVLQEVATRLRHVLRCVDAVMINAEDANAIRWGGDEFVVFLDNLHRPGDVAKIAERILNALAQPYDCEGQTVLTSASLGIVFGSKKYQTPDTILRDADTALFEAKNRGKACWVMFDQSMQQAVERRVQIENELRAQKNFNQFRLLYQPIVSAKSGRLSGVETLLRWQHPVHGVISPLEFIPVAEETRIIIDLGRWVIEQACRQWMRWHADNLTYLPEYVTINLSRIQLADKDFVTIVSDIMTSTGIDPRRVVFEITESTVMIDPQGVKETLRRIKALGIRLAIDDFGTGHSSLACLHEFPFDILKIDRSFVSNFRQSPEIIVMTQAVVALAKHLGMTCVAEGAESEFEVETLRVIDCELVQGYYFGRPMPPEALTTVHWHLPPGEPAPLGLLPAPNPAPALPHSVINASADSGLQPSATTALN